MSQQKFTKVLVKKKSKQIAHVQKLAIISSTDREYIWIRF